MAFFNLTLSVYGDSKSGKSNLSRTAPTPILLFDAENIGKDTFKTQKKVYWNPLTEDVPEYDPNDPYKVCIVTGFTFESISRAIDVLRSNNHPFRSVVFDSVSEIQAYLKEKVFGRKSKITFQEWGQLKKDMEKMFRDIKSITNDQNSPILSVVYIYMSATNEDGFSYPVMQGSAKKLISYISDITAHTYTEEKYDASTDTTKTHYYILVGKDPNFVTGNRVTMPTPDGEEVNIPDILGGGTTITGLLKRIYPELEEELNKPDASIGNTHNGEDTDKSSAGEQADNEKHKEIPNESVDKTEEPAVESYSEETSDEEDSE